MTLKNLLYAAAAAAAASLAAGSPVRLGPEFSNQRSPVQDVQVQVQGRADAATNYQRAADAATILQQWYDEGTGLWTESNWWNSANILQALGDLPWSGDPQQSPVDVRAVYENTFSQAQKSTAASVRKTRLPGSFLVAENHTFPVAGSAKSAGKAKIAERGFDRFLNDYYDDEGWWALALLRAHDLGFGPQYIDMANGIFEDMKGGASPCGGIYWDKPHTYTNAIANELYLAVAASLANRMPSDLKQGYLDAAVSQWNWFKGSGLINSDNLINDGLDDNCQNNGGSPWTYNQGVILGALVELNKATGDSSYIDEAKTIARAAVRGLNVDGILQERDCGEDCGGDGNQFKGIFMRNLQYLQLASPDDEFYNFILTNADHIWDYARSDQGVIGCYWISYVEPATLKAGSHCSGFDALVAAFGVGK